MPVFDVDLFDSPEHMAGPLSYAEPFFLQLLFCQFLVNDIAKDVEKS